MFSNKEYFKKDLVAAIISSDEDALQEMLQEGAKKFGPEILSKLLEEATKEANAHSEAAEEANAHSEAAQTSSSAAAEPDVQPLSDEVESLGATNDGF